MADNILRLKVESSEYDAKLKKAAEGIRHLADAAHKGGGELTGLEKAELDYIKALGDMETKSRTAAGSTRELENAFKELTVIYNNLNDVEKADEGGKALATSLERLKQRAIDAKAGLNEATQALQGNEKAAKNDKSGIGGLTSALGINIKSLVGWGAALEAGKVALDVAKDAFMQTEGNIDDWGRAVQASEAAYNVFLQTLNTGNWSGFFQNLNTAINGARELYNALDRLGSVKSNNQAAIAIVQKQIADLRLMKQQGQNVDDQLKKATEKLANLQRQSVVAGKNAGRTMAAEIIKNRFNAMGGNLAGSSANAIVERIMRNGQSEFDRQSNILARLTKAGTGTRDYGTYKVQGVFDINNLTKEQQKQYKLAKAITEGETEIQKGISIYAQAVSEGTANAREQFKGNRYALQGSGGGGRSGGGKVTVVAGPDLATLFPDISVSGGSSLSRGDALMQSIRADMGYQNMAADQTSLRNIMAMAMKEGLDTSEIDANGILERIFNGEDIPTDFWNGLMDRLNEALHDFGKEGYDLDGNGNLKQRQRPEEKENIVKQDNNALKQLEKFNGDFSKVTGGVSSIVSGIQQMGVDIPEEIQSVLGVLTGISSIITGITSILGLILVAEQTTAAASWTDAIVPFANGGIIKAAGGTLVGNSFSGDNLRGIGPGGQLYGLNAGEVVLNRSQVNNLASALTGNGDGGGMYSTPYVQGEMIFLGVNNYLKRSGRGEIVTSKRG